MSKPIAVKTIPSYQVEDVMIQFFPVDLVGWSHRVVVNGAALYWISDEFKPSQKTAIFYYKKFKGLA